MLLNGETVKVLHVNILKEINPTQFNVADKSGIAILTSTSYNKKLIEVGNGLKMLKPCKLKENVIACHTKFSPMKTKPLKIDIDYERLAEIEAIDVEPTPVHKGTSFKQILNL